MSNADHDGETRQERRARRMKAERERIAKHGAGLRRNFADAALKLARKRVQRSRRRP